MARAGLEPGTAGLRVRRADHSATLPPPGAAQSSVTNIYHIIITHITITKFLIFKFCLEKIKTKEISERFLASHEKKHLRMDITEYSPQPQSKECILII